MDGPLRLGVVHHEPVQPGDLHKRVDPAAGEGCEGRTNPVGELALAIGGQARAAVGGVAEVQA
jgi:hypothetical protein